MNEEIKEIFNKYGKSNYNDNYCLEFKTYVIELKELKILYDYITNLQEDNKELNRVIELYGKSLYNADLTRYKEENQKLVKENEHKDKLIDIANAGISNLQEENQKLNKIIDELEKWLKERINRYEYSTGNMNIAAAGTLNATLNKLAELKNEVE